MNAVEKIKAAAAELNPDERVELFRWWVETPEFKHGQRAVLKREMGREIDDLENGRCQTYDLAADGDARQLSAEEARRRLEDIRSGRVKTIPGSEALARVKRSAVE